MENYELRTCGKHKRQTLHRVIEQAGFKVFRCIVCFTDGYQDEWADGHEAHDFKPMFPQGAEQ